MTICINRNGDIFEELLTISEDEANQIQLDYQITHALVVAKNKNGFLLLYNTWKNHWEVPGGLERMENH